MSTPPPGPVSPLVRQRVSGLFTVSDFESKTHQELRAMVEHAKPYEAGALSDRLNVAAAAIKKVGEDLKAHMAEVEWEGEGGDAFRLWGADMANATLRLSGFSEAAGRWMGHAIATLSDVKSSMPEVSASSRATLDSYLHNNPNQLGSVPSPLVTDQTAGLKQQGPSQQQAYDAQKRLDADQAEAAQLMRKLAQSYAWSAHNISVTERPTFPPIPAERMPPEGIGESEYIPTPGGAVQPGIASGGGMGSAQRHGGELQQAAHSSGPDRSHAGVSPTGGLTTVGGVGPEARPVNTEVDGGVAAPQLSYPPAGGTTDSIHPDGTAGNTPLPSGPGNPALMTTGPAAPAGRVTAGPGNTLPVVGRPRAGLVAGAPGRGVVSAGQFTMPRGNVPGDGIVGGRPVPRMSGEPQAPLSRGTVIGAEPGRGRPQAGPQMGYTTGHPAVPGVPGGRPAGAAVDRRLSTERGGVVGGTGRQRSGAARDGAFTPGGTGLVRTGGDSGPARSNGSTRHGERADYLIDDQETWVHGDRRIVPPVID